MKKFSKMMALLLALVMCMAMGVTAMAATITITQNPETGGTAGAESYNLYKIFDVTKTADQEDYETTEGGAGTETGFSYTISTSNSWFEVLGSVNDETGVWSAAEEQTWVTLTKSAGSDTVYNVTYTGANTEAGAKAFADWLYANKGTISPDETITSDGSSATTTTEVDDGYWLIDSSLGTNLILATSNVTINTKNQYPSTDKEVAETNYNVGDFVEYTITVNLPATVDYSKTVTVHDTMDNVLSLVSATSGAHAWSATVKNADAEGDGDAFTSHVTLNPDKANNHDDSTHVVGASQVGYDFVLDISSLAPVADAETGVKPAPVAKVVTITYYAELTSEAAADTPYVNKEFVEYSEYKTPVADTEVKTYDFDLEKTFTGSDDTTLTATFELKDSNNEDIYFTNSGTNYVKVDSDDGTGSKTLTVTAASAINVRGLKAGSYTLTEKTTADGYNLLTGDITIVIDEDGNVTATDASGVSVGGSTSSDSYAAVAEEDFDDTATYYELDGEEYVVSSATEWKEGLYAKTTTTSDGNITIVNNTGSVLPSTGGIGTTIFYVLGGILVVGAGVVLVSKKRMGKDA